MIDNFQSSTQFIQKLEKIDMVYRVSIALRPKYRTHHYYRRGGLLITRGGTLESLTPKVSIERVTNKRKNFLFL